MDAIVTSLYILAAACLTFAVILAVNKGSTPRPNRHKSF